MVNGHDYIYLVDKSNFVRLINNLTTILTNKTTKCLEDIRLNYQNRLRFTL